MSPFAALSRVARHVCAQAGVARGWMGPDAGRLRAAFDQYTKRDRYNGVSVDLTRGDAAEQIGAAGAAVFNEALADAFRDWEAGKVRGVWLRLPADRDDLIMAARKHGMRYHHARYDTEEPEYMMLCRWLGAGASRLPPAVHHQIGVGGIVLSHDRTRVLAIKEKTGLRPGMRPFWKLPGGLVDRGEDLQAGAVREVWEETGIHTAFASLVGFRETHQARFRNSDLYFVCVLRLDPAHHPPRAAAPPTPTPCAQEISECAWLPIEEWRALPLNRRHTLIGELMGSALDAAVAEPPQGFVHARLPSRAGAMESLYCAPRAKL
eukprot:TRINITY_DN6854_c2_g1_i2.p1 TRINITY_DN6854_c2_g1~~TRINITY_DN6854_c2_g1_i2.p1  ORF type:complete len:321 (+),score=88.60 TRINITY_DN6854_c2_g1_i2:68-1030(+)